MKIWNDTQPIFIQVRQRIIDLILAGTGDTKNPLPSIRQIASEFSVNPLTVTKSYQSLVELGVVEKRRGLGMFLSKDARTILLAHERDNFLNEQWPRILAQIKSLDLSLKDLMQENAKQENAKQENTMNEQNNGKQAK